MRVVMDLPAKAGNTRNVGGIPEWGHGNPLQHSCLENPMDRGAWVTVHRVTKSQTQLVSDCHYKLPLYTGIKRIKDIIILFTPVKMAAIQKSTSNKCWRGCGEKGTL